MKQNDDAFDILMKTHKPKAPPAPPRQAAIIWAHITILSLAKDSYKKQLFCFLMTLSIIIGAIIVSLRPRYAPVDLALVREIEQSYNIDSDEDDLREVSELISLTK